MKTSAAGRAAIRAREGDKHTAYLDSVGVLTIGAGHTSAAGSPAVTKGLKITAAQSDEILTRDLADVEADITRLVKVDLTQDQFDALVSLVFNIGGTAFRKSTLLRKLNAGDVNGAADQFPVWNKGTVGGKKVVIKGLTTRRQSERKQFLSGEIPAAKPATPAVAPDKKPDNTVTFVQQRLKDLGYSEVGTADGVLGKMTKTAILAFRNENDLPLSDAVDEQFLIAIAQAKPRNLPRNDAKPSDVRAVAPEVQSNWLTKLGAGAAAGVTAVAGAGDAVLAKLSPWRSFLAETPTWVWFAIAAAVFVAIFLIARRGEAKGVEAYQTGERR